jgi:hypothetical protein
VFGALVRAARRQWIGLLALLIVVGSTPVAAEVTQSAVRLVTGKVVKDSSLTGRDVKDGSLSRRDFSGSVAGPKGDTGAPGSPGAPGPPGADGADGAPAPIDHEHGGEDITSGTVAEPRIAGALARDSEIFPTVLANDGSGSLLDADTLDGKQASAFLGGDGAADFAHVNLATTSLGNMTAILSSPSSPGPGSRISYLCPSTATATTDGTMRFEHFVTDNQSFWVDDGDVTPSFGLMGPSPTFTNRTATAVGDHFTVAMTDTSRTVIWEVFTRHFASSCRVSASYLVLG